MHNTKYVQINNHKMSLIEGQEQEVPRDPEIAAALRELLETIQPPPNKYNVSFVPIIKRAIALRERPQPEPCSALEAPSRGQEGMRRLDSVVRMVDVICEQRKMVLSSNQKHALLQFLITALPKITGPDQYAQFSKEYFEYLNIKADELDNPAMERQAEETQLNCRSFRILRMAVLIMARQCGKTTCVAMIAAAVIVSCDQGLEMGIYAPVQRQSGIIFFETINNILLLNGGNKGKQKQTHIHQLTNQM
jgi:hypothetical protein